MIGFKGLSFVSLIGSTLFALSACSGELSLPKDKKEDEQPAKGKALGDSGAGTRMQLGLPEDMKDQENDSSVPVQEWEHYAEMDSQFGSELLSLSCDGDTIDDKEDFKGNVKGVFDILVYQQSQPTEPDWDGVECKSKGAFDLTKRDEKKSSKEGDDVEVDTSTSTGIDGESAYCKGDDEHGHSGDDDGSNDDDSGYEGEQSLVAHIVFPYTCEGNAYLTLAVDETSQYEVTANLMTSDLELRYSGTTFVDASLGGLIPLFMEKVEEQKQTSVDIAILFQGDK